MSQQQITNAQLQAIAYATEARGLMAGFDNRAIDVLQCSNYEKDYLKLVSQILRKGVVKSSRTGSLTLSRSAQRLEIDLTPVPRYIPLLHSKQVYHETFLKENRWFFSGSTDIKALKADGVGIWDSWVTPETAVFAPLRDDELVKGQDIENYIRCKFPLIFKELVNYKRRHSLSYLSAGQAITFQKWYVEEYDGESMSLTQEQLTEYKFEMGLPIRVRLVSGDIGSGAYGASWRAVKDTRFFDFLETNQVDFLARGFQQENLGVEADGYVFTRTIDQLAQVIEGLKKDPNGRRHIMSAWNVPLIDETVLPACHSFVQFISEPTFGARPRLVCMLHQRSADVLVGTPFNVGQYAAMTHMIAEATGHVADRLVINIGDAHIYFSQIPLISQQLSQAKTMRVNLTPELYGIDGIGLDDFDKVLPTIVGYTNYCAPVPYPVEV